MRILIINYEFPPIGAGGGKASQKIAASLVEMGHTVRVITSRPTQLYSLFGNIAILIGLALLAWVFYLKLINFAEEDISDHGFTILGTLMLLIGFILRHTGLTWELINPIRGLKPLEFMEGVEVRRVPVLRQRQNFCSTFEMGTFVLSGTLHSLLQIKEFKPDVIHIFFGIPDGPIGWVLKRVHGLPYLISLRGADVPSDEVKRFARHYKFLRPLVRAMWKDADAVVAVSNGLRDFAVQTTPDIPIDVIPNAIELSVFTPPLQRHNDKPPRLLFVGRFNAFKSVETLVEATAKMKKMGITNFELQLVGEGSHRANVERLVVEKRLTRHVQLAGWVEREDIIEQYRQADIFVTATTWEGMPNTVLEGMACGLPVIATRASGLEELVKEGVNGHLVNINDAATLATRMAELINNPHERRRMGKESRKIAEQEFAWEYIAEQYVDIYKRISNENLEGRREKGVGQSQPGRQRE